MRSPVLALTAASFVCLGLGQSRLSAASDSTTKTVVAHASVASRTCLTVSSQTLQFVLNGDGQPATATVDFVAAIRTYSGAEVVLTVEGAQALNGPDATASITFAGEGDGVIPGSLDAPRPAVAGRWVGSGRRTGRIAFSLRANAAGTYTLPLRFVLSAP